jgi:hypothetical protein
MKRRILLSLAAAGAVSATLPAWGRKRNANELKLGELSS